MHPTKNGKSLRTTIALVGFATCIALSANADTRIYPPDPTAGEDIALLFSASVFQLGVRVATGLDFKVEQGQVIASITGSAYPGSMQFPANVGWTASVARNLPAGLRDLRWRREDGVLATESIGQVNIAPSLGVVMPQFRGITGNWYNPQESGWGINVIENDAGTQLLALWLDYDGPSLSNQFASAPSWRVLSGGRWISPTTFRGLLYKTFDGATFTGGITKAATVVPVGYMSITFKSADEMEFLAEQSDEGYVDFKPVTKRATLRKAF